jgi:nucleoside-diphosphate-sugar epimerase
MTNTIGLINVLETWPFEHLVYLSSGAVYIGLSGRVGVDSPVVPTLPYAVSKLASEHYVRAFFVHRGSPRRATILRFFGAFGPYEPARKVYSKLVRRFALEQNPSFTITGDGGNYIDAMYVDDAVRALELVLEAPSDGVVTVDLGVGAGETVGELVRRAGRAFGVVPEITYTGESPEYITYSIDPTPFAERYAFLPEISVEEGFQRLARHLREVDDRAAG